MKRSKGISQSNELSRGRSPIRKMHSARKSGIPRSPLHRSRSGRSDTQRICPTSIKRSSQAQVKHLSTQHLRSLSPPHRPRHHSGDSIEIHRHLSNKKSNEVAKRRHSRSPINHGLSSRDALKAVAHHVPDNYHPSRTHEPVQDYNPPPKKRLHRESGRYVVNRCPSDITLSRASTRHQSDGDVSHRKDSSSHSRTRVPVLSHSHQSSDFLTHHSSSHSSTSLIYMQEKSNEGFVRNSPERHQRIDNMSRYMGVSSRKQFGPTLDERFSSEARQPMEPRIRYTRADLEKITIDIRPTLRESSPTIRRIINPNEIKLVRRPSEGKRPIFDRQEIKQAPKDLREDAHYEQKDTSFIFSDLNQFGISRRYLENYEITRHKFDNYHIPSSSVEVRTLNDRWQKNEDRKEEYTCVDRVERNDYNGRSQHSCSFIDGNRSLHQTFDRDYRENRASASSRIPYQRAEYVDSNSPHSNAAVDFRHSLSIRRKDELIPISHDHMIHRREEKSTALHDAHSSWLLTSKSIPDSFSDRMRGKRSSSRGSRPASPRWESERGNNKGNPRSDKLPDFSQRPDKYKYQPWLEKPDVIPKSPSYYEHDDRYSSESNHLRNLSRPYRGRIFRSRPFRTNSRGGMRGRGMYRGYSSSSPRGMVYKSRRGRFSPSHWEHDMFEKSSQDLKHRKSIV